MTEPGQPLEGDIQHLLATDEIGELGVEVHCEGGVVVLRGQVNTAHRRDQIAERVAAAYPELTVQCEITVVDAGPPAGGEVV